MAPWARTTSANSGDNTLGTTTPTVLGFAFGTGVASNAGAGAGFRTNDHMSTPVMSANRRMGPPCREGSVETTEATVGPVDDALMANAQSRHAGSATRR